MYHAMVRRRILRLFEAVNNGDFSPLFDLFARDFEHVYIGDHALAGRRTGLPMTRQWYQRLQAILPELRFIPHRISIAGPPWNTLATVEWEEMNRASDGTPGRSTGVHILHLRWGRVTRLLIMGDTAALRDMLERTAGSNGGASTAPALDEVPGWPAPQTPRAT